MKHFNLFRVLSFSSKFFHESFVLLKYVGRELRTCFLRGALLLDILFAGISLPIALMLRLGGDVFVRYSPWVLLTQTLAFTFISAGVLIWTESFETLGNPRTSGKDFWRMIQTLFLCEVFFGPYLFFTGKWYVFPKTALLIQALVLGAAWASARIVVRQRRCTKHLKLSKEGVPVRVVLLGCFERAAFFKPFLMSHPLAPVQVVGIVATNMAQEVYAKKEGVALGTPEELGAMILFLKKKQQAPAAIFVLPEVIDKEVLQAVAVQARALNLPVLSFQT